MVSTNPQFTTTARAITSLHTRLPVLIEEDHDSRDFVDESKLAATPRSQIAAPNSPKQAKLLPSKD
jgi:hypothetical protein